MRHILSGRAGILHLSLIIVLVGEKSVLVIVLCGLLFDVSSPSIRVIALLHGIFDLFWGILFHNCEIILLVVAVVKVFDKCFK